jgi:adenylate kinase
MGKVVIISGLPGVGKSTVVARAIDNIRRKGFKITMVNYGTKMMEIASSKGWVNHRDQMRRLSLDKQLSLQREAAMRIRQMAEKYDVVIIDTHMFINTKEGRWPGFSRNNLDLVKPDLIVLIEASPQEILARRSRDESRIRELYPEKKIMEDLSYNRSIAATISVLTGMPVANILNKEGKADEAAKELEDILIEVINRK